MPKDFDWTPEAIEKLKTWQAAGKTAEEISRLFDRKVSRSAVLGKLNRLKIKARPIQQTKPPKPKRSDIVIRVPVAKAPAPKPRPRPVAPPEPVMLNLHMTMLTEKTCRWPNGDPKDPAFGFCGCATAPGLPYCPFHQFAAFNPTRPLKVDNATMLS